MAGDLSAGPDWRRRVEFCALGERRAISAGAPAWDDGGRGIARRTRHPPRRRLHQRPRGLRCRDGCEGFNCSNLDLRGRRDGYGFHLQPHHLVRAGKLILFLIAGGLFGSGLAVSGMTDPTRVIGFLDVFGNWDPALLFVMAGAVSVYGIGMLVLRRLGGRSLNLSP